MVRTDILPTLGWLKLQRRGARRLYRCRRGSAAIEMALVAPVLITALIGILEIAMIIFVNVLLESGLREAARFGLTGQQVAGVSREDQIVNIVSDRLLGLAEIGSANVSVKVYPSFSEIGDSEELTNDVNGNGQYDADDGDTYNDSNGNGVWDADIGVPGAGAPGAIVLYQINTTWDLMTPFFGMFVGENGSVPISASIAVRNEPFNTVSGPGSPPGGPITPPGT